MMQQKPFYPILALLCGGGGFVLRLWQNATGFEPGTNLVIGGALSGWILPGGLLALAVGLRFAVRRLPREEAGAFSVEDRGSVLAALLAVMGVLLAGGSGVMGILAGMARQSRIELLMGALTVVSIAALLPVAAACKRGGAVGGTLLLAPVAFCVVRLVLTYRESSVDPVLAVYYVEILTLSALVMGFYRLSAFGYRCGQTRPFTYWTMLAVALCITVLADFLPVGNRAFDPVSLGFYGGSALALLGLLLNRLRNRGPNAPPKLPETAPGVAK